MGRGHPELNAAEDAKASSWCRPAAGPTTIPLGREGASPKPRRHKLDAGEKEEDQAAIRDSESRSEGDDKVRSRPRPGT